jgi:hypothetical protein
LIDKGSKVIKFFIIIILVISFDLWMGSIVTFPVTFTLLEYFFERMERRVVFPDPEAPMMASVVPGVQ